MSTKWRSKQIRKCARAMVRASGADPDAVVFPTEAVFALMRAGHLPPGVGVPAWRNVEAQAAQTVDDLMANPEIGPLIEGERCKWKFHTDSQP